MYLPSSVDLPETESLTGPSPAEVLADISTMINW
jgi:hypothetical protein